MRQLYQNACIWTGEESIINGCLAIDGDTIIYVGTERPEGSFDVEKDFTGKLLMPGLVNCHTHAAMTLLRGVGTDLPLQKWLFEKVFPVEAKLTEEEIDVGSRLALLEMIACGTTSFSDMYFYPWVTAKAVEECGIKANLNYPVQSFVPGETYAQNESARKMERFYREWNGRGDGRIRVDCCLHAEYTCNPDVAAGTADFCRSAGGRMHIHLSETKTEHEGCVKKYGMTPARWFDSLGVFENPTAAAHCVWVTAEDRRLLRKKGVSVVHNPTSNMKLGSGFAPIPKMLGGGINVALGTDGAASNNNLNLWEEMHLSSIIHNGYHLDAEPVSAREVLAMATVCGARAQGRTDTGLLAAGKKADVAAVDLDRPHLIPHLDTAGLLAYSAQGSDVYMTMADGKILYENGEFLTLDKEKICAQARKAAEQLYR
ncbi:MAG: amidohydrolase [Oscillibacter sp.]|nr:amidohydrolase [Oscillibacter sp.]